MVKKNTGPSIVFPYLLPKVNPAEPPAAGVPLPFAAGGLPNPNALRPGAPAPLNAPVPGVEVAPNTDLGCVVEPKTFPPFAAVDEGAPKALPPFVVDPPKALPPFGVEVFPNANAVEPEGPGPAAAGVLAAGGANANELDLGISPNPLNVNFPPFSAGLAAPAPFAVVWAPKTEGADPEAVTPNALGVDVPLVVLPNPEKPAGFAASLPLSCAVAGVGAANEKAGLSVLGAPNAEPEAGGAAAENPGPENTDGVDEAAVGCPNGEGAAEPLEVPNANPVFAGA